MFPESSGVYIAQRKDELFIVKVKGVYPTMQLDKNAVDLGGFLATGKTREVTHEVVDNIELFHEGWTFLPLDFIKIGVFSRTEFMANGTKLYLSEDDYISIRGKYYRLCEQGVSPMKVIRALSHEFKVSKDQIIKLINNFDAQANISDQRHIYTKRNAV